MSTETDHTTSSLRGLVDFWKHNILHPRRWGSFELRNDGVYYYQREKMTDTGNPAQPQFGVGSSDEYMADDGPTSWALALGCSGKNR